MFGFLKALQAAGSKSLVGEARLQNVVLFFFFPQPMDITSHEV